MDQSFKEQWLSDSLKKELEKFHKKFRSGKVVEAEELGEYELLIQTVLEKLIGKLK